MVMEMTPNMYPTTGIMQHKDNNFYRWAEFQPVHTLPERATKETLTYICIGNSTVSSAI